MEIHLPSLIPGPINFLAQIDCQESSRYMGESNFLRAEKISLQTAREECLPDSGAV